MPYELQFADGFFGTPCTVRLDGEELGQLDLTTRMQTGLAAVFPVEGRPGQELTVEFPGLDRTLSAALAETAPFLVVTLSPGGPELRSLKERPGYL